MSKIERIGHRAVFAAVAIGLLLLPVLSGCSSANLDYVKQRAAAKWAEVGYVPIGYEGFQWGLGGFGGYGGARVWYSLRREPDNGITYTGYLQRWGDELHVYGPRAVDAIKP